MLEWVPWQDATEIAGVTAGGWAVSSSYRQHWARVLVPWAKELTVMLSLYALWQYAGVWSIGKAAAASGRGEAIWRFERDIGLPNERSVQALVLGHRALLRLLNEYYAWVHVPALGAVLLWLFIRHRRRYYPVRTAVALVTGACLVIQLFPVAPPRLLPHLGVVDTAALVGPSDYSSGAPGIDQLASMPSLHVGWAVMVAVGVIYASSSGWRWLALTYPAATTFAVVVTGNHYWADALVAVVICALVLAAVNGLYGRRLGRSDSDGFAEAGRGRAESRRDFHGLRPERSPTPHRCR